MKLSRRIRELATRDLLDESIVGQVRCRANSGGVSDRITVGIAEINSIFVDSENCDFRVPIPGRGIE